MKPETSVIHLSAGDGAILGEAGWIKRGGPARPAACAHRPVEGRASRVASSRNPLKFPNVIGLADVLPTVATGLPIDYRRDLREPAFELPRDSRSVVEDGTRLPASIDESTFVEITVDGVEYRHAARDFVHGNSLRGRELEGASEFLLDLSRSRLDQTGRVRAVSYSVRVARMGGD
jgi:hypothetical protein